MKRVINLTFVIVVFGLFQFTTASACDGIMRVYGMIRYVIPGDPLSAEEEFDLERDRWENGSGWHNASTDLQLMIDLSVPGDMIYVHGSGTYKPFYPATYHTGDNWYDTYSAYNHELWSNGGECITLEDIIERVEKREDTRENSFVLKPGVKIYGGFLGNEIDADSRYYLEVEALPSVLTCDDCYHVIIALNCDERTLLDGFSVNGGVADDAFPMMVLNREVYNNYGGGIYNHYSKVHYAHLQITDNIAEEGGGLYDRGSASVITNTRIQGNTAFFNGGGIYTTYLPCDGGLNERDAVYCYSEYGGHPSQTILNTVLISGNLAYSDGGAILNNSSDISIVNATIGGNNSYEMYPGHAGVVAQNWDIMYEGVTTIVNSIIVHNGQDGQFATFNIRSGGVYPQIVAGYSCFGALLPPLGGGMAPAALDITTDLGGIIYDNDYIGIEFYDPYEYYDAPIVGGDYHQVTDHCVWSNLALFYQYKGDLVTYDLDGIVRGSVWHNGAMLKGAYETIKLRLPQPTPEFQEEIEGTEQELSSLKLYPNPVSDILYFDNHETIIVHVYNQVGVLVAKESVNPMGNMAVSNLSNGVYLVKVIESSGKTSVRNIIVNR